jgi:hypothetical protein
MNWARLRLILNIGIHGLWLPGGMLPVEAFEVLLHRGAAHERDGLGESFVGDTDEHGHLYRVAAHLQDAFCRTHHHDAISAQERISCGYEADELVIVLVAQRQLVLFVVAVCYVDLVSVIQRGQEMDRPATGAVAMVMHDSRGYIEEPLACGPQRKVVDHHGLVAHQLAAQGSDEVRDELSQLACVDERIAIEAVIVRAGFDEDVVQHLDFLQRQVGSQDE